MNGFERFEPAGKRQRFFRRDETDLKSQLEGLIGKVSSEDLERLLPLAEKSLELAVNTYFDGINSKQESIASDDSGDCLFVGESKVPKKPETVKSPGLATPESNEVSTAVNTTQNSETTKEVVVSWPRIVGTFQTALWATRSGRTPKYGDTLVFKRIPNKKKVDCIVRVLLGDEFGPELARVAESDAKFVAPLLDAKLATFTGTVVFCDLPLRTGDTVYAQVEARLSKEAFTEPLLNTKLDPKAKDLDEAKESISESLMSLRQQALNRLFSRVGLIEKDFTEKANSELREVTKHQLDMVYENSVKAELQQSEAADTFGLELYPYQKKALHWMSQRESDLENIDDTLHPLWTEFTWHESQEKFYANLNSGELSLKKPTMITAGIGGILADEMGLGKTIQILSLVHTSRALNGPTLIVAPMSLLTQWQQEAYKSAKAKESMLCEVYYGAGMDDKFRKCVHMAKRKTSIIVTSYGVLASEYKAFSQRPDSSLLFQTKFDRVVLDEAHIIKNKNTIAAKAASSIIAEKRWAVTGTPVINRLEDLYSLIKFLGVQPWNHFSFWSAFITKPFEGSDPEMALKTVQSIVDPICLRRTKDMKHNGKPLVELPEKKIEVRRLKFTTGESELYSFMFSRIRTSVRDSMLSGTATKKMANLLYQILRLRQICCHPQLLRKPRDVDDDDVAKEEELEYSKELEEMLSHFYRVPKPKSRELSTYSATIVKQVVEEADQSECPICFEPIGPTKQALTPCYHMACIDCLLDFINNAQKKNNALSCPICRKAMSSKDLLIVDKINEKTVLREYVEDYQSTKVRALIEELRTNGGNGKNVVFSQFTSFLDVIAPELEYFGFKVLIVDGRLSMQERGKRLEDFKECKEHVVLLLSLKVGGVGLNLTCANQVFMMDPWWNFAIESQAIDRIHRMGQKSKTRVVRFIVEGSIEERMLKIQERKDALSAVVSADEKKSNTLEDIKLLFDLDGAISSGV